MAISDQKHNLAALSTAAIIAVYSAGYVRTKAAAAKVADHAERRPPIRAATPRAAREVAPKTAPESKQPTAPPRPTKRKRAKAVEHPRDTAVAATQTTPEQKPAPQAPAADTTKPVDTAKVVWKDGYYFGWGTSRHGDIQAGVEIKNGRIVSALITQCQTQYSCSWVDVLQGQVVARQSPEVDFISGATQSTNAFYYAVVEALSKAR